MQRDCASRGLSAPDEARAKDRCLGEGVDTPALLAAKDFLRFYVATNRGKVVQRTTADLVNTFAEGGGLGGLGGFIRVTGTPTDGEERSEVYIVSLVAQQP
jgi:hypothetical protein